jgi:hypothetical protein
MPDEPEDPLAGLATAAVSMHELYTSFLNAGFDDNRAMYLLGQYMHGQGSSRA